MAYQLLKRIRSGHVEADEADPRKRRAFLASRALHALDPTDGNYKAYVDRVEETEDEVRHAAGRIRARRTQADIGLFSSAGVGLLGMRVRVQEDAGGWSTLDLDLAAHVRKEVSDTDAARRVWRYSDGSHQLDLALDIAPGSAKWSYRFTAGTAGRFRLAIQIIPLVTPDAAFLTGNKDGDTINAWWTKGEARVQFGWRDMVAQIASHDLTAGTLTLVSKAGNLAAGQRVTLDPSLDQDAGWSADIGPSAKYPDDGADYAGDYAGTEYRVALEFDISSLSSGDTVTDAKLRMNVIANYGGSNTWAIGPYNGDGSGDPSSDAAATAYSRCDTVGRADEYLTGLTAYRSTGVQTTADLGSQAHSDIEGRITAGQFNLTVQLESPSIDERCEFYEYTDTGTQIPQLQIDYTSGGGTDIAVLRRRRGGA